MINSEPQDKAFEEYLARRSALSSRYHDESKDEPPLKLDSAVIAAAHREVGHRTKWFVQSLLRTWQVPVSIAAVVALGIGITLHMVEREEKLSAPPTASAPAQTPARTAEQATSDKLADRREARQVEPTGGRDETKSEGFSVSGEAHEPAPVAQPKPAPIKPGPMQKQGAAPAGGNAVDANANRASSEPSLSAAGDSNAFPKSEMPRMPEIGAVGAPPTAAARKGEPASPFASEGAAQRETLAKKDYAELKPAQRAQPAREADAAAAGASAKEARGIQRLERPRANAAGEMRDKSKARTRAAQPKTVAEPQAASPPDRADAPTSPAVEAKTAAPETPSPEKAASAAETPERWLARILVLRRQGSVAEAHVQLARFKQRYPDYQLPPELR